MLLKKSYKSWKIKSGQEEDVDVKVTLPSTYDATPQTALPGWLADFYERAMSLSAAPITCVYAYLDFLLAMTLSRTQTPPTTARLNRLSVQPAMRELVTHSLPVSPNL